MRIHLHGTTLGLRTTRGFTVLVKRRGLWRVLIGADL